jgi:hypothetical protein
MDTRSKSDTPARAGLIINIKVDRLTSSHLSRFHHGCPWSREFSSASSRSYREMRARLSRPIRSRSRSRGLSVPDVRRQSPPHFVNCARPREEAAALPDISPSPSPWPRNGTLALEIASTARGITCLLIAEVVRALKEPHGAKEVGGSAPARG